MYILSLGLKFTLYFTFNHFFYNPSQTQKSLL